MGYREKVVDHATAFWWRPCEDGVVWIKNDAVNIQVEVSRRKLKNYGGAFLWYSPWKLEGLFLLPSSQIDAAKNGKMEDFSSAIMLASYSDDLKNESQAQDYLKKTLGKLPPYHALNDCTHFTSECLISGGFAVTDVHARRGAPDLWRYLFAHHNAKVLAVDVPDTIANAVISKGLMKPGDVIVYADKKGGERHHAVVYLGGGTIAMHTWHQFNVAWQTAGGDDQLYSLFHISLDDSFVTPWASRWVGWWQLSFASQQMYMYVGGGGHVTVTPTAPKSMAVAPVGPNYWFADNTKMWTCVRLKGLVDEYTLDPKDPTKASGVSAGGGAPITAQKLSK